MSKLNRRDFLKRSAGAVALVLAPGLAGVRCGGDGNSELEEDTAVALDASEEIAGQDVAEEVAPEAPGTVHAVTGDQLSELFTMAAGAFSALGIGQGAFEGKSVFIKPNFVTMGLQWLGAPFNPNAGECTKPELAASVAEECLKAGAAHVVIGEGAQGTEWDWAALTFMDGSNFHGTANLLDAVNYLNATYGEGKVELSCLNKVDEWELVPSASPDETTKDGIYVARIYGTADHVISLPVMKTHQWALVTASLKNLFGLASLVHHGNGMSRCGLHLAYNHVACHGIEDAGVSGSFVDMYRWRKAMGKDDFAIVDGTVCLEGTGPHTPPINEGITIHTKERNAAGKYFLLAGRDYVAVDSICARLMNIEPTEVKALQMAGFLGLGEVEGAVLAGATVEDLKIPDWALPVMNTEEYFESMC